MNMTANQLRAGRVLAGLSLRDIAKAAGLSVTAIAKLETGTTRRPRISTLQALQTILESHDIEFAPCGWVRHRGDHWPAETTDSSFIPLPMTERVSIVTLLRRVLAILGYPVPRPPGHPLL